MVFVLHLRHIMLQCDKQMMTIEKLQQVYETETRSNFSAEQFGYCNFI